MLRNGAKKVTDIANELDLAEGTVRTTLNRHKKYMFVKLMDGYWGLATKHDS